MERFLRVNSLSCSYIAPILRVMQKHFRIGAPCVLSIEQKQSAEIVVTRILHITRAAVLAICACSLDNSHHCEFLGVRRASMHPRVSDLHFEQRQRVRIGLYEASGGFNEGVEGRSDHFGFGEELLSGIEDGLEPAGLIGALIVAVERDQHRFGVSGNDHQFLCVEGRRLRYVERVPSAVAVAMVQIEDLFAARWVAPSVNVGNVGRLADSIDALSCSEGHYDLFGCIDSFKSFTSFIQFISFNDSFNSFHSMIHSIHFIQ